MDMDLDDLDLPSKPPARASKFAPKNSKLKPKPRPKPESSPVPQQPQSHVPIPKKESDDGDVKPPLLDDLSAKNEIAEPAGANGVVKMEIDQEESKKEEEEEEDLVVREIDVFFTPTIHADTQLYVLQYPLRPCWRPYDLEQKCQEVRLKPLSSEIEIDLSVDVDSYNFDPDADESVRMEKQVLSSSWKPPLTTGYAVGVLTGNKLYINPVHAVVQLRPSMRHFKSGGEPQVEKVGGPSKKQDKPTKAANEHNEDSKECWLPLKYHGTKTDASAQYVRRMITEEGSNIQFSMSPYDYINSLCPCMSDEKQRPKGSSKSLLLSMPLEDRYKAWFLEGPLVHRFNALKHLAPNVSDEDILAVIQKHAQLVQGLWVPKSSLLCGKDWGPEVLFRDYVLLQFSKSPTCHEEQLPKTQHKALKEILSKFAVYRDRLHDWKFKEPPDMSFIKLYPNIVKEQEQIWVRLEEPILESIHGKNFRKHIVAKTPAISAKEVIPKASNTQSSRTPMSDETREALPRALQKLFQIHKVCSFNQICQRLCEMAVSESSRPKGDAREARAAAMAVDAPQEEFLAILNQVAVNIHGVFVSKSSPDHPQYNELRKVIIDLFLAEGPDGKLKRAAIEAAVNIQLKKKISNTVYQKVLNELCISQNAAWVLRKGDGNPK